MGKNKSLFSQIKQFAGDSFLYAIMSVSTKLIAFIMYPIYTNLISTKEIAAMSVIDTTISILTILVIFGTDSALAYYYFEAKDLKTKNQYVEHVLSFRLIISLIFSLLFLLLGEWIVQILKIPGFFLSLQISMVTLILDSVSTLILTVYRYDGKAVRVVSLTVIKMLLIALLSYYFLIDYARSLDSVMIGRLLSVGLIFLVTGKDFLKYFRITFDKKVLKELLTYAYPLVPAALAFWVINGFNRYVISWFENQAELQVALYETAFRFASMITLVTYGIQMAWRPYSMQIKDQNHASNLLAKIYILIFAVGAIGILLVATLIQWIFGIATINPLLFESYQYVGVLSFAMYLSFYYLIMSTGLFYTKNTKVISRAFVASAVISVILNISLYPLFGIWGIVIANVIVYAFANTIIFFYSQKSFYVPVSVSKLIFLFVQTLLSLAAIVYIQTENFSRWYLILPWLYFILSLLLCRIDRELKFY